MSSTCRPRACRPCCWCSDRWSLPGAKAGAPWRAVRRDAKRHKSPNAGWPEAALAGALGFAIAGPRSYHGHLVSDPWMNDGGRWRLNAADIRDALKLYWRACAILRNRRACGGRRLVKVSPVTMPVRAVRAIRSIRIQDPRAVRDARLDHPAPVRHPAHRRRRFPARGRRLSRKAWRKLHRRQRGRGHSSP